jgi:adenylate kinase
MYIVMLGAPGSGKGTIGKILSTDLNLVHVSTGDIFREQINKNTELGKKIQKYLEEGTLVPDDVVIETVKARLLEDDVKNGAILDGFPRTVAQAEALRDFLKENKPGAKRVAIELDVPDDEIIKRIVNRLICTNKSCGAIFNKETKPPKKENICDVCGSELKRRDDDNKETVTKRLDIYHQNSKDLIDFYRANNALYSIYPQELDVAVKNIKSFLEEYKIK